MPMAVKHMFGALAVSAAAAMLAACGQSISPQDPSAVVKQPVAPPPPAQKISLPETAKDEPLTANTHYNIKFDSRSYSATSTQVLGMEGCLNSAKEASYVAATQMNSAHTMTSCVARDGTAHARFSCDKDKTTGAIACSPI